MVYGTGWDVGERQMEEHQHKANGPKMNGLRNERAQRQPHTIYNIGAVVLATGHTDGWCSGLAGMGHHVFVAAALAGFGRTTNEYLLRLHI